MIERTSKNCLVIGRTDTDLDQCIALNHPVHPPAPSTFVWDRYEDFDGDIITAHTLKFGAICACAAEASPRVQQEAIRNPGKIVFGTTFYHRHYHFSKEFQDAAVILYNGDYEKKMPEDAVIHDYLNYGQSGIFTLWFALQLGYENIYTVGLDMNSIKFPADMKYNKAIAQDFVTSHVKKESPKNGASRLSFEPGKQQGIDAFNIIKPRFPGQHVFKVSDLSRLPCDIAEPPTKGVK